MGDEGRSESSEEEVVESPDVPRLVVPGLLESVLEKFGQKKTFPRKSSESVVKKATSKSRNRKDMKKLKVAAETVTPKAFPTLARKTSAGAGKVAKISKKRKLSQKAVVSMLKDMLIKKVEVRLSKDWQNQKFFAATAEEVACLRRASSTGDSNGFFDEEIFAGGGDFKKVEVCLSKNWQTQEPFAAKVEEVICSLRGFKYGRKGCGEEAGEEIACQRKETGIPGETQGGDEAKGGGGKVLFE